MARLPKSIIKKYGITKKAWQVFRGRRGKRRGAKPKRRSVRIRRSVGKLARRRYYRRRRRGGGKSMTRTAFKLVRLGALAAPAIMYATGPGTGEDKIKHIMMDYTGFDPYTGTWKFEKLLRGWGPYLGACLATYGIPKLTSIIRRL